MRFIFEQIRVGGDRNFGYLLGDREAGEGILIDPSYDPESLVARAEGQKLRIAHILNTHGHADHSNGNAEAKDLTGDLLFVGKVGGTGSDADARTEWDSLQRLLRDWPEHTTIWPGHDYGARPSSTLAWERDTNPFLMCEDVEGFIRLKAEWPGFKVQWGLK